MPPDLKRLFLAIPLPTELQHVAQAVQQGIRALNPERSCAWVPPENLHLTLRFLGALTPTQSARVTEALAGLPKNAPIALSLADLGSFPALTWARVIIWNLQPNPDLMLFQQTLEACMQTLGIAPPEHPYHPHVTLGRLRKPQAAPLNLPERQAWDVPPQACHWQPEAWHLFESCPSSQGVVYQSVQVFDWHV